ncbi:hypothetical protein [Croceicoccus bisphenolivorans]|uniref:hypothetical protein n=1 Tax=Croceicoccus bisphenolivorans TaxID=1783232 RepID=UPI000AEE4B73|nr:hypothetical protein [Croceicoccus bisphenolivorans]
MKTCLSRVAAVTAIGALALASQPVMADSDNDNAATVIHKDSCLTAVPTEAGKITSAFTATDAKVQRVELGSGQIMVICHFDVPEALVPDSKRKASGFGCRDFITNKRTEDTQLLVSPGGRGVMICRVD